MNEKLSVQLGNTIYCIGCGRTDTGVHAENFFLHFDYEKELPEEFLHNFNSFLPNDIVVKAAFVGNELKAHARRSALFRTYQYRITLTRNPFLLGLAAHIHYPLDIEAMRAAAMMLMKYEDYRALSKVNTQNKQDRCTVTQADWMQQEDLLIFEITANRFLRGMVRIIAGTLLEVGRGRLSVDDFENIILSRDRKKAKGAAPAEGLYLTKILYPQGLLTQIQ